MTIIISVVVDDHADAYRLAHDLTRIYGADNVSTVTEHDDDETAADIAAMSQASRIIATAPTPTAAIEALRELQAAHGSSNDRMRWLDGLISRDQAPPRDIEHPELDYSQSIDPPYPRPVTQGGTHADRRARQWVCAQVTCPKCGQPAGLACRSAKTDLGYHTTHIDRIDVVYGRKS